MERAKGADARESLGARPAQRGEAERSRVLLVVYSDYLCPWCHLAEHRLRALQAEVGDALSLTWRSFLLRPRPDDTRDLERFVRYTQSWLRPAAEPDAPRFRVWESTEGPPSHSVPPHLVAKAAAELGPEAFAAVHERLLRAYFEESRDISRADTLKAIWREAGLPAEDFARSFASELLEQTVAEHREATELGVTGVPAVRVAGTDAFVVGAQPLAVYRRWVERLRAGVLEGRS